MRKFPLILILATAIALTSCSDQPEEEIEISDFEKKQECYTYGIELEEKYQDIYEIEEIFYSPSADSCLYTYVRKYTSNENLEYHGLVDALSGELLFGWDMDMSTEFYSQRYSDFYQKVEEYK